QIEEDNGNDVDIVYDETTSFMASKHPKISNAELNKGSSGGGNNLYGRWKESYDEDLYDDDEFNAMGEKADIGTEPYDAEVSRTVP
ncbi:hypothetical protein Tco_0259103, partial [Tanacetum coccineum]